MYQRIPMTASAHRRPTGPLNPAHLPAFARGLALGSEVGLLAPKDVETPALDEPLRLFIDDYPILHTDDDPLFALLFRELLELLGLRAFTVTDTREACELCAQQPLSLLLTDYRKPVMNGLELARWARANARTPRLPVLFVSATLPRPRMAAEELGHCEALPKPLEFDGYLRAIERLVRARFGGAPLRY